MTAQGCLKPLAYTLGGLVVLALGFYWVFIGILDLVHAFTRSERRGWNIFTGILGLLAGGVILAGFAVFVPAEGFGTGLAPVRGRRTGGDALRTAPPRGADFRSGFGRSGVRFLSTWRRL